ncbi:GNAT family N-acetyltransferase [Lentzea alba]|uniref:GNAT family N-acetyltransferase n=1 Tax=Lentzea alba TaxID=2714351 RepID=UPI0039BF8944
MTSRRSLIDLLELRHLKHSDIPGRVAAMADAEVRRNISSLPALYDEGALTAYFTDVVEGRNPHRIELVLTRPDGETVAYNYLLGVDWANRTCEIGMITLPSYRFGFGLIAMLKTYEHAFGTLNMRSVLNEVYSGNEMMSTGATITDRAQVVASSAQFTEGQIRDTYFWTETRAEFPVRFGRYFAQRPAAPSAPETSGCSEGQDEIK